MYFKGKKVYAYVCNSFESNIFSLADESITYKDKFTFPYPEGDVVKKQDYDSWAILELGFFPLNDAIEQYRKNYHINLLNTFKKIPYQFHIISTKVKDPNAVRSMLNNIRAIRYKSGYSVLKIQPLRT